MLDSPAGRVRDPKGNPLTLIVDTEEKFSSGNSRWTAPSAMPGLFHQVLATGDRVIVEGLLKVKPGIPVKAVPFENGKKRRKIRIVRPRLQKRINGGA